MKKENGNIGRQGLLVNSMMSGKKGYRHELFGDTYLEFAKNKKLNWKFRDLDSAYKNSTFPITAKALAKLTCFMCNWIKDIGASSIISPYYIGEYFDDDSFSMMRSDSHGLFFPFKEDKQWANVFWVLSRLNKSCIESLLGRIYSDTKEEDQGSKITELIGLLSVDGYTVQPRIGDRVYVEIKQSQGDNESVRKVVNKVRTKKIPSGIKQKTLQELACFIDGWVEELKTTREPLVVWKYKNPYWFIPQRRKRKDLYDYLLSCKLEQIAAVIKIVYGSTEESQKSDKLDKLNEIFNKDFYEIAFTSNILEIRKITIVYL